MEKMNEMLSELLKALDFAAMAEDVKSEMDIERLRKYARVVAKNANNAEITNRLRLLRLV